MAQTDRIVTMSEYLDERERVARSDWYVRGTCIGVTLICFVLAGFLLPSIYRQRVELQLVISENSFRDMPPGVTLPAAFMGPLRAFLVNIVGYRAEELKQESKYYELQQLYAWLCDFQPRMPKVWANSSWNMAYNISVGTFSPEERWHWVSAGLYLLRDEGIPRNPNAVELYKELSWIFLHKMGDFMDDQHWNYKKMWAVMMEKVLGQPPPEPTDEEVLGSFRTIAEAAKAIRENGNGKDLTSEGLQRYIQSDVTEPTMSGFVGRLAELGYQPDEKWLEDIARYLRHGLQLRDIARSDTEIAQDTKSQFRALMSDEKWASARDRLLAAIRAYVLANRFKMNPEFMLALMEKHGPIDWRNVYSSALYWAALGGLECREVKGTDENVVMNIDRQVQSSLKDTCERGLMVLEPDFDDPFKSYLQLHQDWRFVDAYHQIILELAEENRGNEDPATYYRDGPAGRLFKDGHVNFLHRAVQQFYLAGRIDKAEFYYDYLRQNYFENGHVKDMYQVPLKQFALKGIYEDLDSYKTGPDLMNTMLTNVFVYLAYDRDREANQWLATTQEAYQVFMSSKKVDRNDRRKIPEWPKFKAGSFEMFMKAYPLPVIYKVRAWHKVDTLTQLYVYRRLEPMLTEGCNQNVPPLDLVKSFPPPAGLEEFEAKQQALEKEQPGEGDLTNPTPETFEKTKPDEGSKR